MVAITEAFAMQGACVSDQNTLPRDAPIQEIRLEPSAIPVNDSLKPPSDPGVTTMSPPAPTADAAHARIVSNAFAPHLPNISSSLSSMLKMSSSMAYDNATVNARMLDVTRREREGDCRQKVMDEAALKF